jgi:ADP-heptose:LPS heptosyltransferase
MVEGSAALATPFGVDLATADLRPEIFLTDAEREAADWEWSSVAERLTTYGERWLINISAGTSIRRWPNERWVALIAHLRQRQPADTVAVIGSARDWPSVCDVAYASGAVAVRTERLRAALALIGTSTRVVTADTSITHAASAFCVPTVVLIQQGLSQWLPWRTPHRAAYWSGATIASLSIADACEALDGLLQCSLAAVG